MKGFKLKVGVLMREREELESDVEDDVIAREGVDLIFSLQLHQKGRWPTHEPQVQLAGCLN